MDPSTPESSHRAGRRRVERLELALDIGGDPGLDLRQQVAAQVERQLGGDSGLCRPLIVLIGDGRRGLDGHAH
jgi:hypothetical protein